MGITEERLRGIHDEDGLFEFLRQELNWPINAQASKYPFYPDELGLTEEEASQVEAVSQIAPFTTDQPWGIFLVKFVGERIYERALRRVLRGLSETRRDRDPSLPAWKASNLLFICTPNFRDFSFARFDGQTHTRGTLSIFGWDSLSGGLRTLCEHNLPALRYPRADAAAHQWIEAWASAWNVERVTERFYDAYRAVFERVESMVEGVQGDKRLFAQRLFNRLMFIHFLSKKKWLQYNGRYDYLSALFETAEANNENFYRDRLYWAFFYGLGTIRDSRETHNMDELAQLRGDVPFLNGGLFEMADDDDIRGTVKIENAAFDLIINSLFKRFNFTVHESTPLDVEVAVDPEMLGKVFEELVTGRHESGSYYTPRPIVSFMCREALKGYLGGHADLVDKHDTASLPHTQARSLLQKLSEIRVVDPACGSGAYLLGMLQELFTLVRLLEIRSEQATSRDDYQRKLSIIRNNLYGVDIDEFAVNIARLRLWLSLIVDFEGDKPEPLPNLDFKVECGDSLSAPDPSGGPTADIFRQKDIDDFRLKKEQYADPYYPGDKTILRREIEQLRSDIGAWAHPGQNVQGFDWRVEFAEVFEPQDPIADIGGAMNFGGTLAEPGRTGGFDVVLANPPYVRQELIRDQKPTLAKVYPEVFIGTADLYCYFYARAIQMLAPDGMLAFISPNKWFRAGYGAKLRKHISEHCGVLSIVDFADLPVFQDAIAYPMIFVAQKGKLRRATILTEVKSLNAPYPDVLAVVGRDGHTLPSGALNGSEWALAQAEAVDRLTTMKKSGVPLGEYVQGQFFRGILTGLNAAFFIDGKKRAELILADPSSASIIKPLSVGRDVRRWIINYRDTWLIYAPWDLDIDAFPAIKEHLSAWKADLQKRPEVREGRYNWWCLARYGSEFAHLLDRPKIVYQEIATFQAFALDTTGVAVNNKIYFIASDDLFLLGVLNSSSVWEFLRATCAKMVGGALGMQAPYLMQLPIPNASTQDRSGIANLVQKCLDAQGLDCGNWEIEINERVKSLYGL
jgi:type I restriction-modification system DNA methylase subunit